MNLSIQELETLVSLLKRLEGSGAKQHAAPSAKRRPQRKASAPKAKPAPVVAQAKAAPAPADETKRAARRAKVNAWAKARRERKRAAKAAATAKAKAAVAKQDLQVPSADIVAKAKEHTAANLSAAAKVSAQLVRDVQGGRLCSAEVISKVAAGLDLLRDATTE